MSSEDEDWPGGGTATSWPLMDHDYQIYTLTSSTNTSSSSPRSNSPPQLYNVINHQTSTTTATNPFLQHPRGGIELVKRVASDEGGQLIVEKGRGGGLLSNLPMRYGGDLMEMRAVATACGGLRSKSSYSMSSNDSSSTGSSRSDASSNSPQPMTILEEEEDDDDEELVDVGGPEVLSVTSSSNNSNNVINTSINTTNTTLHNHHHLPLVSLPPTKRRRINSEPPRELLCVSLKWDGRGRKPRAASSQSESDSNLSIKDRKKEQNKDAAKRYRLRKKSDRFILEYELQTETSKKFNLNQEIESLTRQIDCLKRCLRDAAEKREMVSLDGWGQGRQGCITGDDGNVLGGEKEDANNNDNHHDHRNLHNHLSHQGALGILAEVAAAQIPV